MHMHSFLVKQVLRPRGHHQSSHNDKRVQLTSNHLREKGVDKVAENHTATLQRQL